MCTPRGCSGSMANMALCKRYSPPEVVEADHDGVRRFKVDSAVDIWAIGVIACELITGKRAFVHQQDAAPEGLSDASPPAPRTWNLSAAVKDSLSETPGLADIIEQCLRVDPHMRPSAKELRAAWKEVARSCIQQHTHSK